MATQEKQVPIDFTAVKRDFDLEQTVIGYLGQPTKRDMWPCPFHHDNSPSFGLWDNGQRFKCFGCGAEGDVVDFVKLYEKLGNAREAALRLSKGEEGYYIDLGLSKQVIAERKAQIEAERAQQRLDKQAQKAAKEQDALTRIAGLADKANWYHSNVGSALDYWHNQGIGDNEIKTYKLGFAPTCPILYPDEERQASYVIPYYEQGQLVSIRHRLSRPNGHGKYRPEFAGLPPRLFNTDSLMNDCSFMLNPNEVIIVEGEVKSIVISDRMSCPCVGLPGATNWREDWARYFKDYKTAYWMPDPGLDSKVITYVARGLKEAGMKVLVCSVPAKPDDLFSRFSISIDRFYNYLQRGRVFNG